MGYARLSPGLLKNGFPLLDFNTMKSPSRVVNNPERRADRHYVVSNVAVSVYAPSEILRVLDVTLTHVPRHSGPGELTLKVTQTTLGWQIADEATVVLCLPWNTAAPDVAGALTTAMVERVSLLSAATLVTGVIVAKSDFAMALVGDDWGSCIAIALHLSLRGWSIVTPRHAFVDNQTREVEPFSKLLYIPTRIISLLPLQYRRALEASPWYSTGNELGFYGVDPLHAQKAQPADRRATLRAALIVDSSRSELRGVVYEPAHAYVGAFLPFSDVGMASASVVVGSIVPTADAVENWASSLFTTA